MIIDHPASHHLPALRALWKEAFGDTDDFLDLFFFSAYSPSRCRCIFRDDVPVAVLYWFTCHHESHTFAYIYAVATALSCRGQGLCARLMADTHAYLKNLGYDGTLLVPGSESLFRFYEKLGYTNATQLHTFTAEAAPSAIPVQTITPTEYAALRRDLLPSGGVLQEEENLAFLQKMAALFRTEKSLFAAYREKDTLHCMELLGDAAEAGSILTALGCPQGTFRIPGTGRPYTMYYPLTDVPAPAYFGLGFD